MQVYLLYFGIGETDFALGRTHVDRPAGQSHRTPAGAQGMRSPNPLKQTRGPGPSGAARSRPGGEGTVLECLSGRVVQQPADVQLRAALPPSRNASCVQVSGADSPPRPRPYPAPNRPRPLARPRLLDPPIAEPQLTLGARRQLPAIKDVLANCLRSSPDCWRSSRSLPLQSGSCKKLANS